MRELILCSCLFIACQTVFSQEEPTQPSVPTKHHAFSGTLVLGVGAGPTWGRTDYSNLQLDLMGRATVAYYLPTSSAGALGIRGFVNGGYVSGKRPETGTPEKIKTPFNNVGAGLAYTFSIEEAVFPYVFAGASYMWFNAEDVDGNNLPGMFDENEVNYHAEIGAHLPLATEITLDFSIGAQFSPEDNWDALSGGGDNDYMLQTLIGLSYSIFATSDEDNDGVTDDLDRCPKTPEDVRVDEFGCPLDADNDGVPDYLDKCKDTPAGSEVDKDGCPIDSDGDGVPNNADRCPGTASGARVDANGCPDTDGDGVPDDRDKCAETPQNVRVDEVGCPVDSDRDGVPDHMDDCPNTPPGQQVDARGCATEKLTKTILLSGDTNFEVNKSTLLPTASTALDGLAQTMKDNPETRWRVEGHTDASGSEEYNMTLAKARAEAIVTYLVSKGIDRNRLDVVPMGETQPVGDNKTSEGRAMNRRVEIKLIEDGSEKNQQDQKNPQDQDNRQD